MYVYAQTSVVYDTQHRCASKSSGGFGRPLCLLFLPLPPKLSTGEKNNNNNNNNKQKHLSIIIFPDLKKDLPKYFSSKPLLSSINLLVHSANKCVMQTFQLSHHLIPFPIPLPPFHPTHTRSATPEILYLSLSYDLYFWSYFETEAINETLGQDFAQRKSFKEYEQRRSSYLLRCYTSITLSLLL